MNFPFIFSASKIYILLSSFFVRIIQIVLSIIFIVLILNTAIYVRTEIYEFPKSLAFRGRDYFNPYAKIDSTILKANFHAHSKSWAGLTYGKSSDQAIYNKYSSNDYDVIGISNYHEISGYGKNTNPMYVKVYEHGFNIFKSHLLVIDPDNVSFFDYPLYQSIHHQQQIINSIRENNGIVVIAHPDFDISRRISEFEKLNNYNFLEVLNHYRNSEKYWDKALSAGKLSWLLANDDIHDHTEEAACKIYNVIFCKTKSSKNILTAILSGKHYGVKLNSGECHNKLNYCSISNYGVINCEFKDTVKAIEFIGQNGKIKKKILNSNVGAYRMSKFDTYIRIKAYTDAYELYLNPIIRTNNEQIDKIINHTSAKLNMTKTIMMKAAFLTLLILLVYSYYGVLRKTEKFRKVLIQRHLT